MNYVVASRDRRVAARRLPRTARGQVMVRLVSCGNPPTDLPWGASWQEAVSCRISRARCPGWQSTSRRRPETSASARDGLCGSGRAPAHRKGELPARRSRFASPGGSDARRLPSSATDRSEVSTVTCHTRRALREVVARQWRRCLEPISKSPEEDQEASKLDKAEEVVGVVFPAN